jgi:hypothetical protein
MKMKRSISRQHCSLSCEPHFRSEWREIWTQTTRNWEKWLPKIGLTLCQESSIKWSPKIQVYNELLTYIVISLTTSKGHASALYNRNLVSICQFYRERAQEILNLLCEILNHIQEHALQLHDLTMLNSAVSSVHQITLRWLTFKNMYSWTFKNLCMI